MTRTATRTLGLVLAALLAASLLTGALAAPAAAQDAGNQTTDSPSEYTLAELREPGRRLDNSPPSVRIARDPGLLVWLNHVPAGSLAGSDSRQAATFVSPNTVVKRNEVHLRSNLVTVPAGADDLTAKVVAYRTTTDENGSEVATNVTVREQTIDLEPGFARSTIALPQVDGPAKQITLWLVHDGERVATWQFRHRSAATTVDAPLDASASLGDLVGWATIHIGSWIAGGAIAGVLVGLWAVKKARTGPGGTGIMWLAVGIVPGLLVLGLLYFNLVELLVTNRFLFALVAAPPMALLAILVSPGTGVEKGVLLRPSVTEVESPSGDEGRDYDRAREKVVRLVDTPTGGKAIVKEGWLAFLARVKGGLATVDNWEEARSLTQLENSTHDWWHIISPSSAADVEDGDLYGYERPGLTLEPPADRWGAVTLVGFTLGAGLIAWGLYPGTGSFAIALGVAAALFVGVVISLEGTDGWAVIPWGSKHHRRAYATASELAEEMDAADSVDASERARMQEKASTEARARQKAADYETSYLGELFGQGADLEGQLVDADSDADASHQVMAAVRDGDLDPEDALELLGEDVAATDGGRDE